MHSIWYNYADSQERGWVMAFLLWTSGGDDTSGFIMALAAAKWNGLWGSGCGQGSDESGGCFP
jgi:hypothetical protein